MKLPSVMKGSGRFARVPVAEIPRSQFDRSHGHKLTYNVGKVVPMYWDDVMPGDTFNMRMTAFARLSTPVKPIMDNLWLETFFFFVPNRLIWDNWVKFCGEQEDPGDSTSYTVPMTSTDATGIVAGRLPDYLGVPTEVGDTTTDWKYSALPHRAYFKIWNEWFRDQNLQDSVSQQGVSGTSWDSNDGPDEAYKAGLSPLPRGKRHDYFTSCLPWTQKGTAIGVPMGTIAAASVGQMEFVGHASGAVGTIDAKASTDPTDLEWDASSGTPSSADKLKYSGGLTITAPVVNELREAIQVQKLLERDARGGTRYPEIIQNHFKVFDPMMDVLQRPEYLGGGRTPIVVNAVAQTSETNTTEQGNLAGVGTAVAQGHGFTKSFTEHGIVMGLCSVVADLTYQQGLERAFSRSTRYDFYWPDLAHLGEQTVYNKEIYLQDAAADDTAFGYQGRFDEYRYKPSRISGEFRSNHTNTLEVWHLGQDFASLPSLDSSFIVYDVDMARILASATNHHILMDCFFKLICARPMPMYSIPGLGGRF